MEILDLKHDLEPRDLTYLGKVRANTIAGVGSRAVFLRSPYPATVFEDGLTRLESRRESLNGPSIKLEYYDNSATTHDTFDLTITSTWGGAVNGFFARLIKEHKARLDQSPIRETYFLEPNDVYHGGQQMSTQELAAKLGMALRFACTLEPVATL